VYQNASHHPLPEILKGSFRKGEDLEALIRAAHRKRGEVFDVEGAVIVNYEGYRIAILRAA